MAKKSSTTAFSHPVLAISLLIALVTILVLMMGQLEKKQTTSSQASELAGSCRTYFLHSAPREYRGAYECRNRGGGYKFVDIVCNGDRDKLTRTIGSSTICSTKAELFQKAEKVCKDRFPVPDEVCASARPKKPVPTHSILPE